jgi:hypothetical protein
MKNNYSINKLFGLDYINVSIFQQPKLQKNYILHLNASQA